MTNKHYLQDPNFTAFLNAGNGKSLGSGFLLADETNNYLVTARHVLYQESNLLAADLLVTIQGAYGNQDEAFLLQIDLEQATVLSNMADDVAVIVLPLPIHQASISTTIIQLGSLDKISLTMADVCCLQDVGISNDAYLIGYPTSLVFDGVKGFNISRPLLRKGIVAGINAGGNTFTIDCPAYQGNSGGPVLEACADGRLRISGVVSRYVPFVTTWRNNREASITHVEYTNSGYTICVAMDAVLALIVSSKD